MKEEQKQKFRELAKLSKEKGVPEGWVYVGEGEEGEEGGLGFGDSLRDNDQNFKCIDGWSEDSGYRGTSRFSEYICTKNIWDKVIGPDNEEIISLSKQTFSMGCPAETVYIGCDPIHPCFEFTENHYCMDRRTWEEKFGPFSQPLPDKFSVRRYWPEVNEAIEEHLTDLGYGYPENIPSNFIVWDGKNLRYQEKSELPPLPLEVLFSGERRKQLDLSE